jgi:hypothetical protein
MISADTLERLDEAQLPYILGTRMRRVKKIKAEARFEGMGLNALAESIVHL